MVLHLRDFFSGFIHAQKLNNVKHSSQLVKTCKYCLIKLLLSICFYLGFMSKVIELYNDTLRRAYLNQTIAIG